MNRVCVVGPGPASVGEWRERLEDVDVVAVMSEHDENLLGPLVAQLGGSLLISATRPVGEALKIVAGGLVIETVDRSDVVQPTTPFAFRVELARPVLAPLEEDLILDVLPLLAREATPVHFQFGSAEPGPPKPSVP